MAEPSIHVLIPRRDPRLGDQHIDDSTVEAGIDEEAAVTAVPQRKRTKAEVERDLHVPKLPMASCALCFFNQSE